MRLLLELDSVSDRINPDQRQQITPDMRFTCDGMITKWIIGAQWFSSHFLYPELQLWRNSGNDVYRKINGTVINIDSRRGDQVYKYDSFSPIPFQAGDILGVFIADDQRIRPAAEEQRGPTNYYIDVGHSTTVSPFKTFDLRQNSLRASRYHPLISVEIREFSHPLHTLSGVLASNSLHTLSVPMVPLPVYIRTAYVASSS